MTEDGKLTGHSALIAGGSSGIGLATAKLLAAEGCDIHLAGRNDHVLSEAVDEISDLYGVDAEAHATDLSDSINAAALALECEDASILVNAFGSLPHGDIEALEADDWLSGFELRVFGAINLAREVLESMSELESGIIINVGGLVDDSENQLCVTTANAALQAFSENLDRQSKRSGVRVLTFIPEAESSIDDQAVALTRLISGKLFS